MDEEIAGPSRSAVAPIPPNWLRLPQEARLLVNPAITSSINTGKGVEQADPIISSFSCSFYSRSIDGPFLIFILYLVFFLGLSHERWQVYKWCFHQLVG